MRATAGSTVSKEVDDRKSGERPPTAKNELSLPDLGAQGDVLLRGTSGLLGGHLDCDPVVLGLCGCCSANAPLDGRLQNFDGCGENCPTEAGGEGPQKAGQSEIPGSSPKSLRPMAPLFDGHLELFLEPTKRIFLLDLSRTRPPSNRREVDKPERWLPRMPHPNSLPCLFEWRRRASLDGSLQIGVILSLDAFPGFVLEPGIAPARSLPRFSLFPPGLAPIGLAD